MKEIAEAFSIVTGQEISEEEVSLILDIQLPEDEGDLTKDTKALEGKTTKTCLECRYNPDVYFVECICCDIVYFLILYLVKRWVLLSLLVYNIKR